QIAFFIVSYLLQGSRCPSRGRGRDRRLEVLERLGLHVVDERLEPDPLPLQPSDVVGEVGDLLADAQLRADVGEHHVPAVEHAVPLGLRTRGPPEELGRRRHGGRDLTRRGWDTTRPARHLRPRHLCTCSLVSHGLYPPGSKVHESPVVLEERRALSGLSVRSATAYHPQ